MEKYEIGMVVTAPRGGKAPSGAFTIKAVGQDPEKVLLGHPLFMNYDLCLEYRTEELDKASVGIMGSAERSLYFTLSRENLLNYATFQDLKALALYFVVEGRLTPQQKKRISDVCGEIARIELDNNLAAAKDLVNENVGVLDEFNLNWYSNYLKMFLEDAPLGSKKIRQSIFNIAGFVLAELMTVQTSTRGTSNG